MLASVDTFYDRRYLRGRYDCLDFACEVWEAHVGRSLRELLPGLLGAARSSVSLGHRRAFEPLERPSDPCLVLMRRAGCPAHVGVYLRGRVLHLHEQGPEFQLVEVASRGFQEVRYYRCRL